MRSAVATAVPDGESAFPAWCASTISIDSNQVAACSANLAASTAPTEKFGTISTAGASGSRFARREVIRSLDHPLVPTRTGSPASVAAATTAGDTCGSVTSTTASTSVERERVCRADALHDLRFGDALHHLGDETAHAATGSDDGEADHGWQP